MTDEAAPPTLLDMPEEIQRRLFGMNKPRNCLTATGVNSSLRRVALKAVVARAGDPSVLRNAILAGHTTAIRALLDNGADVNHAGNPLFAALRTAPRTGRADIVKLLLDCGADVHMEDGPLLFAVKECGPDVVRVLLDAGADPNKDCPLIEAAYGGGSETVRLLLERGADVHVRDSSGRTALHATVMSSTGRADKVRLLILAGVDVYARTPPGSTSLAGDTALALAERSGGDDVAEILRAAAEMR